METKQIDAFAAHAKDADWVKDGLRPYFRYRDLGITDATQGRVLAQVIKAAEPCKGADGLPLARPGLPDGLHAEGLGPACTSRGWARCA